jgi:hypothetical protein
VLAILTGSPENMFPLAPEAIEYSVVPSEFTLLPNLLEGFKPKAASWFAIVIS